MVYDVAVNFELCRLLCFKMAIVDDITVTVIGQYAGNYSSEMRQESGE